MEPPRAAPERSPALYGAEDGARRCRASTGSPAAPRPGRRGALEDFTTSPTELVDVPGAVEAGRLQVRYEEPNVDGTVVSDVLVVVTERHVYDLRFARVGDDAVPAEDVEELFASVSVEP